MQFLYDLKERKTKKTCRPVQCDTETGLKTQQEASALVALFAETVRKLAKHNELQSVINDELFCSTVVAIDGLRDQQSGALDESIETGHGLQKSNRKARDLNAPDTSSVETQVAVSSPTESALDPPFDSDVVVVDSPNDVSEDGRVVLVESLRPEMLSVCVVDHEAEFDASPAKPILGRNNSASERALCTMAQQADAVLTHVGDADLSEVSEMEEMDDSADHRLTLTCSALARTPLPNVPISAGQPESQPFSHLDRGTSSTTQERRFPLNTQPQATRRTDTTRSPRKRSLAESTTAPQTSEDDNTSELDQLPPKRKDTEVPSPERLAKELISADAVERIRRHVLAHNSRLPRLPPRSDEHEDWAKKSCRFLNLAEAWEERSEFSRLVALTLRGYGIELLYVEARRILMVPDLYPTLPKSVLDSVAPYLLKKRSLGALRSWLQLSRKLLQLSDYLPFMPFGGNGTVAFRHYERLANEDIKQLRHILDNNQRARGLAAVGRAFRDCILKRQAFLWEELSPEKLSKLSDDTLLHLLTTRRVAETTSTMPGHLSKQCDVCEGETCELSTLDRLPSTHADSQARELYDSDQYFSTDNAPHYPNNSAAWESLQAIDTSTSAMLLSSVKDQSSYNAFWPADYTQAWSLSPQLQLALPRKVSDTAQSIEFAMKGNIDCLKAQFSLGLASPRDESHSRGWTLLKVSVNTLSSLVTLSIAPE